MSHLTAVSPPEAPTYRARLVGTGRGYIVESRVFQNEHWRGSRVDGPYTTREQAEARADELARLVPTIVAGLVFDTPFESGCVVVSAPDSDGSFDARDSDGIVCQFHVCMVKS